MHLRGWSALLLVAASLSAAGLTPSHRRALTAIRDGDLAGLRAELDAGLDADAADPAGLRLMVHAVLDNQPELARELARRGADLRWRTAKGLNGYGHICVYRDRPRVLEVLLTAGLDPDQPGSRNGKGEALEGSPLTVAASEGKIEMVRILIRRGANLNHVDALGGTPTFRAWEAKEEEIARLLEKYGATDDPTAARRTPLRVGTRPVPPPVVARGTPPPGSSGLFGTGGAFAAPRSGGPAGRRPVFEVTAATVLGGPLSGLWATFSSRHAAWGLNAHGHRTKLEDGVTIQSTRRIDALPTAWARELYALAVEQGYVPGNPGAPFLVAPQGGAGIVAAQEEQRLAAQAGELAAREREASAAREPRSRSEDRPATD